MADYDTLRAAIDSYIKANGNKEITGTVLNDILNAMVSALGADTRFAGVAVPSTNPGNHEGNVVYFASQAGTYSNFGGIVLPLGIHILVWNGTAWTSQTWFSVDNTPTQNSQNLVTSGGIFQAIVDAVGVERLRAIGAEVTSASFNSNTKKISFFNSANSILFQLDATAFIIDGMVSDVKIENGNLVIKFNTDAGKQDIEIPLTDIFNPANYYTKTAIDALLTAINNKLADGCLYRGMAEPTTNPPTPSTKVFYIATKAGTYTNFGNIAVTEGITILKYDGSNWSKEQISYSDGVFDISAYNATGGTLATYADLSAALDSNNGGGVPQPLRKGGMSVKFVQSSDNKYVQWRLMADSWTTDNAYWQKEDIYDALGILFAKTYKNSTSWQTNNFSLQAGVYQIEIKGSIHYIRLLDGTVTIWSGSNYENELIEVVLTSASASIEVFNDSGSDAQVIIYNNGSYIAKFENINEKADNLIKEVGLPKVINKTSSVWNETAINISAGTILIHNSGSSNMQYFAFRSGETVVYNNNTAFAPDEYKLIELSSDCDNIRAYGSVTLDIYDKDALRTLIEKQNTISLKKADIISSTGQDTTKVMNQKSVSTNLVSPIIDCPDYLNGIVQFDFFNGVDDYSVEKYEKIRIKQYIKDASWNLYLILEYYDGTDWITIDSVQYLVSASPSNPPAIEKVISKYERFAVWINWSMMTAASQNNINKEIKPNAINYFGEELRQDVKKLTNAQNYDCYELKDFTRNIVTVDASGNGDYTTIRAAYDAIKDSSYMNQYEVVVYPGTYNETDLIPPIYTHTHGLRPNTVTVHNQGLATQERPSSPVFDLMGHTSKLSNMTIISYLGYCIHLDESLVGAVTVCENLYCKKVYNNGDDVRNLGWRNGYFNPSIIGIGADFNGAKFIFKSCTFVDGAVASHTNPNAVAHANQTLVYEDCKLVNAYINLLTLSNPDYNTNGLFNCIITGLQTQKGFPSVRINITPSDSQTIPNCVWRVSGGNNKNFAVIFANEDTSGLNIDDYWVVVDTNEKTFIELANGVSASKMQLVDITGNICDSSTPTNMIYGFVLEDTAQDGTAPVWVGNALPYAGLDGEYGIGSDGKLSASATTKIGFVKNNIFYRY